MAKMKLNPTVDAISGQLGNMVHRQLWGQHVVSRPPDFSNRVPSAKQLAANDKYKCAGLIWKGLSDQVKAAYKAWGKRINKPPYALFNKNFSRPPTVKSGRSGRRSTGGKLAWKTGQPHGTGDFSSAELRDEARIIKTMRPNRSILNSWEVGLTGHSVTMLRRTKTFRLPQSEWKGSAALPNAKLHGKTPFRAGLARFLNGELGNCITHTLGTFCQQSV